MTQEQSHPDQEGDTDNRRRRQSGQVTQQGALLSGRPAGLPTRAAARSAPALIGVTGDEHWVIWHGPTYALLLIANQRPAAPSPLRAGANSGPPGAGAGPRGEDLPCPVNPAAGNGRERAAQARRREPGAAPDGLADRRTGPRPTPGCRPQAPPRARPAGPSRAPPQAHSAGPARPTGEGRRAAPTRAPQASWGPRAATPEAARPAGRPGAACGPPWSRRHAIRGTCQQAVRGTACRPTLGTFAGPAGSPVAPIRPPARAPPGAPAAPPGRPRGPSRRSARRPILTPAGARAPWARGRPGRPPGRGKLQGLERPIVPRAPALNYARRIGRRGRIPDVAGESEILAARLGGPTGQVSGTIG